jgi:hypothetical protein
VLDCSPLRSGVKQSICSELDVEQQICGVAFG